MIEISLFIISILAIVTLEILLILLFIKHFKDISNSFERRDKKYVEINKKLEDINSELIKLNGAKLNNQGDFNESDKDSDKMENIIKAMENIIKIMENKSSNDKLKSQEKENPKGLDINVLRKSQTIKENLNNRDISRKEDNVKDKYEKIDINNNSSLINQERMNFNGMDSDLSDFTINKSYKTHIITKKEVKKPKVDKDDHSNKSS